MNVSEIGFSPGKNASSIRAFDNVDTRKGYSGLYQLGAAYDPEAFNNPVNGRSRSGNYLLYWMASQALWRADPREAKGLDATFAVDWSPSDVNRNNRLLTAGLRFNEPLPLPIHNTVSIGYVQNSLLPSIFAGGSCALEGRTGVEINSLLLIRTSSYSQWCSIYDNVGGREGRAVVVGFEPSWNSNENKMFPDWRQTKIAIIHGVTLAASCAITTGLSHTFSAAPSPFLGTTNSWEACGRPLQHYFCLSVELRTKRWTALSRMTATAVSFALCLIYLLMFPFHLWGMAVLIGIGTVTMSLIGRPDDMVKAGITTAVVMVIHGISPRQAWIQPVLRLVDTIVGVGVGVVAAWLSLRAVRPSVSRI